MAALVLRALDIARLAGRKSLFQVDDLLDGDVFEAASGRGRMCR